MSSQCNTIFSLIHFQVLLEKFLNLGESEFQLIYSLLTCLSPFTTNLLLVSAASCLTGDDRNIVEVFVAGRKVVPFTEPII